MTDPNAYPWKLDRHRYAPTACPDCGRACARNDWCASCGKTISPARSEMAEAMNREPDPATDNGYGPRAVND